MIYAVSKLYKNEFDKNLFYTLLLSFSIIYFNPFKTKIISNSIRLFKDFGNNVFTTEFLPVTNINYWNGLTIVWFILTAYILFRYVYDKKYNEQPMWYNIILLSVLYLSLKANRNIPLFVLVFSPFYSLFIK